MARPSTQNVVASLVSPGVARIEVDRALVVALRTLAAERQTTVPRLVSDLLEVIVADRLTGAILDR